MNYPITSFSAIDGFMTMILTYATIEDALECNNILLEHVHCLKKVKEGKPNLVFQTPGEGADFSLRFDVTTQETQWLIDGKITVVKTAYPLESGQLFYNPSIPIRF